MAIRPDIKQLLQDQKVWKKFYTQRDALKLTGADATQMDNLLASFIVACPGGKAFINKEGLPLANSKKIKPKTSKPNAPIANNPTGMRAILTEAEINELSDKEASLNDISKWVSAAYLRNRQEINFKEAPDIRAVSLYFAYEEDQSKFHKEISSKCLKFDEKLADQEFDGANLAFFACELREINETAVLRGAENERMLEDKRQAVLSA